MLTKTRRPSRSPVVQDRGHQPADHRRVEYALMEWGDWYNNARIHSRLGYLTPAEYESAYYAQREPRRPALVCH
jgi:transposase InsO family protein